MQKITPQDIQALVAQFQDSSWKEMRLTFGDVELFLSKDPNANFAGSEARPSSGTIATSTPAVPSAPTPAPAAASVHSPQAPATDGVPDGWFVVRAPSLGTFYRAPKPGAPVFCDKGQTVTDDSELCLIEVMKLFTTVRAKTKGTVREIYVNDGEMVEFNQPLFLIEPND